MCNRKVVPGTVHHVPQRSRDSDAGMPCPMWRAAGPAPLSKANARLVRTAADAEADWILADGPRKYGKKVWEAMLRRYAKTKINPRFYQHIPVKIPAVGVVISAPLYRRVQAALRAVVAFSFDAVRKRKGYRVALERWCTLKRQARQALNPQEPR